jgi:hypothetical protein
VVLQGEGGTASMISMISAGKRENIGVRIVRACEMWSGRMELAIRTVVQHRLEEPWLNLG